MIEGGADLAATSVLLGRISVQETTEEDGGIVSSFMTCRMNGRMINEMTKGDPLWKGAMELRLQAAQVLDRVGVYWRAALVLSLAEQLVQINPDGVIGIEGDVVS